MTMVNKFRVFGFGWRGIVMVVIFPFFCWAFYQDMKSGLSWPLISVACLLGLGWGFFLYVKIINPVMAYLDNKVKGLFGIK